MMHSSTPFHRIIDWYNNIWRLSSVLYESIPAYKAGKFFRHLQYMFEVEAPENILSDLGISVCVHEIGYYCRILCQLESYKTIEFDLELFKQHINTDYARQKALGSVHSMYSIADSIGYTLKHKPEQYNFYDESESATATSLSHVVFYTLEEIRTDHAFTNLASQRAIEFYCYLVRFVLYAGQPDHAAVPSYITKKLTQLINEILAHPVSLSLPEEDDFFNRECLVEVAPSLYQDSDHATSIISRSTQLIYGADTLSNIDWGKLLRQLEEYGFKRDLAQEELAKDLSNQASKDSKFKEKLQDWALSLGNETVSDVAQEILKLALRFAGIPIP